MDIDVVVFDMDDTLYPEISYVHSGFNAVAKMLSERLPLSHAKLYDALCAELIRHGRGKVFDSVLNQFGYTKPSLVKEALRTYRTHFPDIGLTSEAIDILQFLKQNNIPMYLVTDGHKNVQANKVKALQLENYMKKVFITHRYGIKNAKPSPYCFLKIAQLENKPPQKIVYIADNVKKDFIGIKPYGFRTIHIRQGMFYHEPLTLENSAEINLKSLNQLKEILK